MGFLFSLSIDIYHRFLDLLFDARSSYHGVERRGPVGVNGLKY